MEQSNDPHGTPKDATEVTEDQQEVQEQLDHKDDNPGGPGEHESREQIADET